VILKTHQVEILCTEQGTHLQVKNFKTSLIYALQSFETMLKRHTHAGFCVAEQD
jgi:hypothetical protein